jgi:hypothetical protein
MKEYLLNVSYNFEGMDDLEARQKAKELLEKIPDGCLVKLREISTDKAPRNIPIL